MVKLKKVVSLSLVSAMALSVVGCSGGDSTKTTTAANDANKTTTADSGNNDETKGSQSGTRVINVGTWYDHYYTSAHDDIYDQPDVTDEELAQLNLDNIRRVESEYDIELYFKNLTWNGTINSINSSIMAGTPDVDIYESDLQFGVPAVLNGYALPVSSYAAADDDIFTDNIIFETLNIPGQDEDYLFKGTTSLPEGGYCLGFNMDMIKDAGLENPQDLYDRGEWTWDKFLEYLGVLTQDTDGDGDIDVYGYGGWWTTFLTYMLMSNGTDIAATSTSHLDSAATIETIQWIDDLYNKYGYARPWNADDWDNNNTCYVNKETAFWIGACWIASGNGDSDPSKVSFEVGYVPFPVGPNVTRGEGEYKSFQVAGSYYFIPKGISDADFVFEVFSEWANWYDGDTELRDNSEWWESSVYSPKAADPERNYQYLVDMRAKSTLDLWGSLGSDFSLTPIMTGQTTTAQYIEENKQLLQDAIDQYFK
ncbi:MAG: extracellular solute-binding protein [Lachnospiraceae bacterium]|nr:extracellular solute-binding protein [Lachnospiraceae bacterium]